MNGRIHTDNSRSRGKRGPARLVWGLVLSFVGVIVAAVGGFGLSLATGNNGYVDLGNATFHGNGYAVVTDGYDWANANVVGAGYDTVRVQLTSTSASPVFVGLAKADDVRHYLAGVAYTTATEAGNQRIAYTDHQGNPPATLPARAGVWLASATGDATQTFHFNAHSAEPGMIT